MSNFTQINDLPKYDLYAELNVMLQKNTLYWNDDNQICINTILGQEDNFTVGSGSLIYDWDQPPIQDEYVNEIQIVNRKEIIMKETDFTIMCSQFKNTKFEEIYEELNKKYKLGRVRLMRSRSKTCLSWHTDDSIRLHYPLKTQEGCLMIIEDEVMHLTKDTWWMTNTAVKHTAINASREDRIHLVAVILEEY
jgi:hypothetical protein